MPQCKNGTEYLNNRRELSNENSSDNQNSISESYVRWKLAKNHCWPIIKSWICKDAEVFGFQVVVSADKTEDRFIKFKDACKEFSWKSFKFVNNDQSIVYKMIDNYEDEIVKSMNRATRNMKRLKQESETKILRKSLQPDSFDYPIFKKLKRSHGKAT